MRDKLFGGIVILAGAFFIVTFSFSPNFQTKLLFLSTTNVIVLIYWCGMVYISSAILIGSGLWRILRGHNRAPYLEIGLIIFLSLILFIMYSVISFPIHILPPPKS